MKNMLKFSVLTIAIISLVFLSGCGISKAKYESLLNEKIALEEKVGALTKSNDALKSEYDSLLSQKMDLATKVMTLTNEKAALKGEYDKILDEKITLKAAYDKLQADTKAQSVKRP
jgi:outer membrane murein-binding lipoprotein Lpp